MRRASIWPLIAATAGLVILAVLLLTAPSPPAGTRIPGGGTGEILRARVERVLEQGVRPAGGRQQPFARLQVRAEEGSIEGMTIEVEDVAIGPTNTLRDFRTGDTILISYARNQDGTDNAFIVEYVRTPQLAWLAAIFAVALGLVGGFQGLRSLLGMAISFLVILRFIIPHILAGNSPVVVSVAGALLVLVATLYLSHGFTVKTSAALVGTVFALLITGVLGELFIAWTRLNGLASEEVTYLSNQAGALDFQGLLLAGLIIGTLGVLDDVAVSQASAVFELRAANPALRAGELIRRGMRIGRDHIASTVNTLFLVYAGTSLPLLLLLSTRPEPLGTLLNREQITVEIVGAVVGSLGLMAAVPFTTAVAAVAATRIAGAAEDEPGESVRSPSASRHVTAARPRRGMSPGTGQPPGGRAPAASAARRVAEPAQADARYTTADGQRAAQPAPGLAQGEEAALRTAEQHERDGAEEGHSADRRE